MGRLTSEQEKQYEAFVNEFAHDIRQKIEIRDRIVDALKSDTLSAAGFLRREEQLAKFYVDNLEVFDETELDWRFQGEYWRMFPKPEEDSGIDFFDMLADGINFSTEEEE
ncbi:MAG: hypothetical protein K2J90_05415 [Lachnospiraceae bacterium]|nr:hypothetical protein [Lachnospiraceae bacterium]